MQHLVQVRNGSRRLLAKGLEGVRRMARPAPDFIFRRQAYAPSYTLNHPVSRSCPGAHVFQEKWDRVRPFLVRSLPGFVGSHSRFVTVGLEPVAQRAALIG